VAVLGPLLLASTGSTGRFRRAAGKAHGPENGTASGALRVRFCDELDGGFGWIVDDELLKRCSHALVADGRVWVIDGIDAEGVEERIRAAGEPAGVIQLLDRHNRDCRALAERLGVPHHPVPTGPIAGAPFEFLVLRDSRLWREVALWWPERRVLVSADVLGTVGYFVAPGERLGVHPLLRLVPPRRQLGRLQPDAVLCGHGEGVLTDAAAALTDALAGARRRLPSLLAHPRRWRS